MANRNSKKVENQKDTKKKGEKRVKEKKPLTLKGKILRVVLCILAIPVIAVIGFFGWLTANEYKPADVEKVEIDTTEGSGKQLKQGDSLSVVTWNIGYGALGDNADFFMDGGTNVMTAVPERVDVNLAGVNGFLVGMNPDIAFIQEIDRGSKRSYNQDEATKLQGELPLLTKAINEQDPDYNGYVMTFAYNFKVKFVPYPVSDPIGKVESGISILSKYEVNDSERISLPCPYSWPVKTCNLKRCLLVNRTPVYDADGNDTGKELVCVNLHLEAYDNGEGKIAQTNQLREFLQEEYNKGNYVIAGGDFNQTFSNVDMSAYPVHDEIPNVWKPGQIDVNDFGTDFQCLMDPSSPTCRSLDKAYNSAEDKMNFQYYMLDGFIVSNNLKVEEMVTQNTMFAPSDHNPVQIKITLE